MDMYIEKILEEFDYMNYRTIISNKHRLQYTYRQFYYELVRRHRIVEKTADLCTTVENKHLKPLMTSSSAHWFLNSLYKTRESMPPNHFVDRCEKVIELLEGRMTTKVSESNKENEDM